MSVIIIIISGTLWILVPTLRITAIKESPGRDGRNDDQGHLPYTMENHKENKQNFYLKTLFDARCELRTLEDIQMIMNTFLLMAMGPLGITRGFVLLIDRTTLKEHLISRGLENHDIRKLRQDIPCIIRACFSDAPWENASSFMDACLVARNGSPVFPFCPDHTKILIKWFVDKTYVGLTGFGPKILPQNFCDEDIEFLFSLLNSFMFSINNARSVSDIQQLSLDIQERNNELEKVLKQTEESKKGLDQRMFHLKSLYDLFLELSSLRNTKKIMETFLLMLIGVFSVKQACILLFDREDMSVLTAYRGIEKDKLRPLPRNEAEDIILQFSDAAEFRRLTPMNAQILSDRRLSDNALCPMKVNTGLVFAISRTCTGMICFGDKITRQSYSQAEQELLLTLANNFMVFLENSRSFETIQSLNADLEKRNTELNKTVEDLTRTRHKIEVLEIAKTRIKSLVQREMARMGQVTVTDLFLIVTLGLLLGLIYNFSSPGGIDIIPQILLRKSAAQTDVHNAKLKRDAETAIIVDARPSEFFRQKHIQGAVNLPLALFDFVYMMKFSRTDPQKELIVYGRNISRHYDEEVAFKLVSRGHKNVKVLKGGMDAWEKIIK